jgi:hypothetical protein
MSGDHGVRGPQFGHAATRPRGLTDTCTVRRPSLGSKRSKAVPTRSRAVCKLALIGGERCPAYRGETFLSVGGPSTQMASRHVTTLIIPGSVRASRLESPTNRAGLSTRSVYPALGFHTKAFWEHSSSREGLSHYQLFCIDLQSVQSLS